MMVPFLYCPIGVAHIACRIVIVWVLRQVAYRFSFNVTFKLKNLLMTRTLLLVILEVCLTCLA
jgi:hypothetical protein